MKSPITGGRKGSRAPKALARDSLSEVISFVGPDGFMAFVPVVIAERMVEIANRAAPLECAALLATRSGTDESGEFVLIVGLIPFEGTRATRVAVEMTPFSELRAREVLLRMFPDAEPGGWFHTHPGLGVFFSETDRETQRTWTARNALGVVVDPTAKRFIAAFRGPSSEELELSSPDDDDDIGWNVSLRFAGPPTIPAARWGFEESSHRSRAASLLRSAGTAFKVAGESLLRIGDGLESAVEPDIGGES